MAKDAVFTKGEADEWVEKIRQITTAENQERDRRIQKIEDSTDIIVRMDERMRHLQQTMDGVTKKLDESVVSRKEYDDYKIGNDRRVSRLEKAIIGFAIFIILAVGTAIINGVVRNPVI